MTNSTKLEIGSGNRPTPGYLHSDINKFDHVEIVCNAWEIPLQSDSLTEVIAMGVVEHLTFPQVKRTFENVRRMLTRDGRFIFDVPDLLVWSEYLYNVLRDRPCPFSKEHVLATIYGWQRWEGDEHKSGWTRESLARKLGECGFGTIMDGEEEFRTRPELWRRRLGRAEDAHIRIVATK
jgi:predicted SAM-dependent methyltransferase